MAKNIVLLSDGTGNSSSKLFKTNVWRLYQALDLSRPDPAMPNKTEQIACYDDGVGTSSFKPLAILGGAFGWGLKRNVLDLYTFLCRKYEPGDRIYGFGFSRGAFTIRVLTGLIMDQGLVKADTEEKLRRAARAAYREYRRHYKTTLGMERPCRALRDMTLSAKDPVGEKLVEGKDLQIAFLGLWDTVAAYGLPFDELTRAFNWVFPLALPGRRLSKDVLRACHALALDDERNSFHPVLWDETGEEKKARIEDERISQVWFAGMHSNVGGGYPDDGLAHVALNWMMDQVEDKGDGKGLIFKKVERDRLRDAADVFGKIYDSRHGLGGAYRYLPRKVTVFTKDAGNRVNVECPKIHESVFERIRSGGDSYAPFVLPGRYAVVTKAGDILDAPPPNGGTPAIEHPTQAESREHRQEKIWNTVWWKRVAYFSSVAVSGALLAFPLYRPATTACEGPFCGLSPVVSGLEMFLPAMAAPWIKAFQSHPGTFGLLALLLIALIWIGSRLQLRISDKMRTLGWKPALDHPGSEVTVEPPPNDALFRLRTNSIYQGIFKVLKQVLLPLVAGLTAVFVISMGVNQGLFAMLSSAGCVCTSTSDPHKLAGLESPATFKFDNKSLCQASGISVEEGKRYLLTIKIDEVAEWKDASIPTGIGGYGTRQVPKLFLGLPLRRHVREPWFKPIARIGNQANDEYPLKPLESSTPDRLVAELSARRGGELFLFVNDAVLPVPKAWQFFYNNNHGTATVTMKQLAEPARQ